MTALSADAFDQLASAYDTAFTDTPVGRTLRAFVWERLDRAFRGSQNVLELGCGTGEDALRLARKGVRVVATDASPRMIAIARAKARDHETAGVVEFHCQPMEHLGPILGDRTFDGVFSNFGAINCVRDLPALAGDVAARLRPGARLIWVVMGRHVPWEWVWYLLHGEWSKAWRRLRQGGVAWRGLTIAYPTPAELAECLRPAFRIERVVALGFALPPTFAADWLNRSPRLLRALTFLERLAQRSRALAAVSDHYIIEATRLPSGAQR
jgi:SAM-dependent methyltransferase